MATSLDEITSEPPQSNLSPPDPMRCGVGTRPLHAPCPVQEEGLLSHNARHLKVLLHSTDEEAVEIRDGIEPSQLDDKTSIFSSSISNLFHTTFLFWFRWALASRPTGVVAESDIECGTYGQQSLTPEESNLFHTTFLFWFRWALASRHTGVVAESDIECGTYGQQSLTPEALGGSTNIVKLHRNISGEGTSTIHNPGDVSSPTSGSFDRIQQVHKRLRWTILGDSLLDVIVQGPFALVGLKTSNASSPIKEVLFRVVVIVYTVAFVSALGGKLMGSSKMGVIGSAAAVLGFLLTMILLLL